VGIILTDVIRQRIEETEMKLRVTKQSVKRKKLIRYLKELKELDKGRIMFD
jgi:hypothetical protein